MLVPARTDTAWFHDYILGKAEIRFVRGRLKFGESKNSAPFPSMVVVFRPKTGLKGVNRMTNNDKINAMSFEEKVRFFAEVSRCAGCPPGNPMDCMDMDSCAKCWEDYLKKTVEG